MRMPTAENSSLDWKPSQSMADQLRILEMHMVIFKDAANVDSSSGIQEPEPATTVPSAVRAQFAASFRVG